MNCDDLMQPRNASELQALATPSRQQPTLAARREALAFLHARGLTLPDTTATAASRAAWAARNATAVATVAAVPPVAPVLPGIQQPVVAPQPSAPPQDAPDREQATVAGLKALVSLLWGDAAAQAMLTGKAQALVASVNARRDVLMTAWLATGKPATVQMQDELQRLSARCRSV